MSIIEPERTVAERMFELLPAVYRMRDAEHGGVLKEIVGVLAEQVEVLREEMDQLYDDQFIETCAEWVAPYIGDLIGYRLLHGDVPEVAAPRAEVANTVAYRRRKGTATVLEQLARDVTGRPARAVEFFERLVTTQYLNHPRPHAQATVDFRNGEALRWIGQQNAAFDDLAHTGDVRRIDAAAPASRGRHNISNVGIFLWRIEAVRRTLVPMAEHEASLRFRFDVLGTDTPLFAQPETEPEITHLAEPYDVPLPLGRRWLADHRTAYYGPGLSLELFTSAAGGDPVAIAADRIQICDLSDVGGSWAHLPGDDDVAIDPVLGRVALGTALPADTRLLATWHEGVAVPIGAGTRTRVAAIRPDPQVAVTAGDVLQPELDAIAGGGTLTISDHGVYDETPTIKATTATGDDPDTVVHVVAADEARPLLDADGPIRLEMEPRTTVVLDGLLIAGGPLVLDDVGDAESRTIILRNCTLVPGHSRIADGEPELPERASLIVLDPFAEVEIERSVLGPVIAVEGSMVKVTDSALDAGDPEAVAFCGRAAASGLRTVTDPADEEIGDGTEPGGGLDLHESTVIGGIHATQLDASNSLLLARLGAADPRPVAVHAERRQVGCLRFSYVPPESRVGRRHHCQPDPHDPLDVRHDAVPRFTSLRYGDPAYLQLTATTPATIRTGADDESEMGATHLLYAPQWEANLLLRLDEYLRFGLQAGFFYAT
jgi:hypothetical protein